MISPTIVRHNKVIDLNHTNFSQSNTNKTTKKQHNVSTTPSTTPIVLNYVPMSNTSRRSRNCKVLYPIFLECENLIVDNFWKSIFHKMSQGKFPKGFKFKNNAIIFKHGSKTFQQEILDNPYEIINTCISFYKTNAGMSSSTDLENQRKEINETINKRIESNDKWGCFRKHAIKQLMINDYAKRTINQYNLDPSCYKQLVTIINLGFILGKINSSSIQIGDNMIKNIRGINFNPDTKKFYLLPNLSVKNSRTKSKYVDSSYYSPSNKLDKLNLVTFNFLTFWKNFLKRYIDVSDSESTSTNDSTTCSSPLSDSFSST